MLINEPEPIIFDFGSRWKESLDLLESDILFTSGRAHYSFMDPDGKLLMALLQRRSIRAYAQKYLLTHEATPEEYREADRLASLVNKRNSGSVLQALRIYKNHEPLDRSNEYNALFYPALNAYVRFGNLYPAKLLAMLREEQCNGVTLFRDCVDADAEDRFFRFTLGISKADYLALIAQEQERRAENLAQALRAYQAKSESLIPALTDYDEEEFF